MYSTAVNQIITSPSHKWLVIILVVIGISVLISNQFGSEISEWVLAVFSVVFTGVMTVFAIKIILVAKSRYDAIVGLAFAAFAALSFVGEAIWAVNGLVFNIVQFSSMADVMWVSGYVSWAAFAILFIMPFRRFVSKKVFVLSVALAASYLIPIVMLTASTGYLDSVDLIVASIYPITNAIMLQPLVCLFVLFYGIKQNYLWAILLAVIVTVATNTGYLFLVSSGSYYSGHPIWLGYVWSYVIMAYAAYRQSSVMKNMDSAVIEQMVEEVKRNGSDKTRIFVLVPLIIFTAVIVLVFSLILTYRFNYMSTRELSVFEPIVYGGIVAMTAIMAIIVGIIKKTSLMKAKIEENNRIIERVKEEKDDSVSGLSNQTITLEKGLVRTENVKKYSTWSILAIGIVISLALGYYVYTSHVEYIVPRDIFTAKFIIENLKGDTVDTWVAWQLEEGDPLHIDVINSDLVSEDKIDAIKNAILSEETVKIPNSELGKEPADLVATYYVGWRGALQEASQEQPQINIPLDLQVDLPDRPTGDVVIVLSNLQESDGTLGFTKSIADGQQHQILKSTITIFDVENLNTHELTAIIRHEFGHALGLGHSTAKEDLMYPKFNAKYSYISDCDINAVSSLYDKQGSPIVVCEN